MYFLFSVTTNKTPFWYDTMPLGIKTFPPGHCEALAGVLVKVDKSQGRLLLVFLWQVTQTVCEIDKFNVGLCTTTYPKLCHGFHHPGLQHYNFICSTH